MTTETKEQQPIKLSTNDDNKAKWSDLKMFLCTYGITLNGISQKFDAELMNKLEPKFPIVAINSNFGHKCLKGYENRLRTKETKKKKKKNTDKKERKHQGDGSSFSHGVVFDVENGDRIYHVRCFTASGDTQILGVIQPDFSDAKSVTKTIVNFLNETKIFKTQIEAINEQFTMRNYAFTMNNNSPNLLIKFARVAEYFNEVQSKRDEMRSGMKIANGCQYVDLDILSIRQVKYSNDDGKLSITFENKNAKNSESSKMLLRVFPRGKMNILGVKPIGGGVELYEYIKKVFDVNWNEFMMQKPKPTKKK